MRREKQNNLSFLSFHIFKNDPGLFHAVTTRNNGISPSPFHSLNLGINTDDDPANIKDNHSIICRSLGIDIRMLISSKQIHKDRILTIEKNTRFPEPDISGRCWDGFDAIITDQPGYCLMIRIADCVPILLFDPELKIVAVVHAGWKGTLLNIAPKCVDVMQEKFGCNPSVMKCGIGPSIGKCCFDVQPEIAEKFKKSHEAGHTFVTDINGGAHIDLKAANRLQLMGCGLKSTEIEISGYCTACRSDIFFSHRREQGRTGRFSLLAGLKPFGQH